MAALLVLSFLTISFHSTLTGGAEFCSRDSEDSHCVPNLSFNLSRVDGKKLNHTWTVQINAYKSLTLRTVSMQPQVIEIPNFLTETESDHIVKLAKKEGMEDSKTTNVNRDTKDLFIRDLDDNKRLSLNEMRVTIQDGFDIYFEDADILVMYEATGMDENKDGEITPEELFKFSPAQMEMYLRGVMEEHPEKHSRYSQQTWLFPGKYQDDVFISIQKRLSKVLELPVELVRNSHFQIVHYGVKGHYNAHLDSSPKNKSGNLPCCMGSSKRCRLCRYLTALFYLNDVEEGGETAFVMANSDPETVEKLQSKADFRNEKGNLFKNCHGVGLRVPPKKGKAVIWYNHFVDPETGWLGALDNTTVHGGCNVLKGEKWIANFWILLSDDKEADMHIMDKLRI